jgi:hypothetical protein
MATPASHTLTFGPNSCSTGNVPPTTNGRPTHSDSTPMLGVTTHAYEDQAEPQTLQLSFVLTDGHANAPNVCQHFVSLPTFPSTTNELANMKTLLSTPTNRKRARTRTPGPTNGHASIAHTVRQYLCLFSTPVRTTNKLAGKHGICPTWNRSSLDLPPSPTTRTDAHALTARRWSNFPKKLSRMTPSEVVPI